jgi:hypothetical protein
MPALAQKEMKELERALEDPAASPKWDEAELGEA